MASYALLLACSTQADANSDEGVFDNVQWVSKTGNPCPNPASAALSLDPGDQVTFAVQVKDANGNLQPGWLNWVAVMVTAATAPGNRDARYADNNSPFRIGTGSRPNTVLLASSTGSGVWSLTKFDGNGNSSGTGNYQGVQYVTVAADIPPGSNRPSRNVSQYEAVVVASVTDNTGQMWQYGFDPEMDVNNNN